MLLEVSGDSATLLLPSVSVAAVSVHRAKEEGLELWPSGSGPEV